MKARDSTRPDLLDRPIPVALDPQAISAEPMAYLQTWRQRLGDIYALDTPGPLLSQSPDCTGVIAVFGATYQQAVLADIERFVLPVSAAIRLELPPALRNLNAGLHSMRGEEHRRHKQLLSRVLSSAPVSATRDAAERAASRVYRQLRNQGNGGLLAHMRELTLQASSQLLFGDAMAATLAPGRLMTYFQQRRAAAAPGMTIDSAARAMLIRIGLEVDADLRAYRRAVRAGGSCDGFGALAPLATDDALDEDAFVAHANILFISCNEPIAIALFWTLLALSQLPDLRMRLRAESHALDSTGHGGNELEPAAAPLLDAVLKESLRVLTPNALMVRVTHQPVKLGTHRLPAGCEVLLSPFLSHRDPLRFSHPDRFSPSRWHGLSPSPYEYFPFGAGGHGCIGRVLAWRLIHSTLAALIRQGDMVLDGDAEVDWCVRIMLTPTQDPLVRVNDTDTTRLDDYVVGGRLSGGIAEIIALSNEWI
ncbi:cytochrome P450 [Dyella tabacisoli]|uniref:Cytochrome P450 n=1 Tax=Dyella tabacisoli TaxID=2282381 RepID=A0A369UPB7_9GAMM|nr:cytochrome P450 [Dyella tabacisoli]RDD82173.1 cytochrome P450 [Dyella tabacisoli]